MGKSDGGVGGDGDFASFWVSESTVSTR